MELLQSQDPVDQELSGSSASARHGTSDIGHLTSDMGHGTWEFGIIEERLSLEGTKCSVSFRVVLSLSYIGFCIPCSKNVKGEEIF